MISVLIATRDRARLLEATLAALAEQQPPGCPYEIVVADNASADRTRAVVEAAAGRSAAPVIYLREHRAGKSFALNAAARRARGDLLVLTDDDVLPSQRWLAEYRRAFEEAGIDYAAGRILPLWETPPPAWMSPALYGVLAVADGGARRLPLGAGINQHIMPIGCNMAVRRAVVERVGGWNTSLGKLQGTLRTGEDHEFALRMTRAGCRGVYLPEAWVRHRVPADRLDRAYFQRWLHDNGAIVAGLERAYPTTDRYFLSVPRHLWRQAARTALATARARVSGDLPRAVAGEMRLRWMAGYVGARWRQRRARRGAEPALPVKVERVERP